MRLFDWFFHFDLKGQAAIAGAGVSAFVSLALGFLDPFSKRRLERLKNELEEGRNENAARRTYEFDALKRLYDELEPLMFQLFEAAEGSYYRVTSLVRTQRNGNLGRQRDSWLMPGRGSLSSEDYYLNSTIYRIFLPIVIYRLIQNSATFVDLNLDGRIRTTYFLLKISYFCFTDDFEFAKYSPKLKYAPNVPDWNDSREREPAIHWRQGLVLGQLDQLIEALIVTDTTKRRPMTYGEFESAISNDDSFSNAFESVRDIFIGFSFGERPVLTRVLIAHACIMRLLLFSFYRTAGTDEFEAGIDELGTTLKNFRDSEEATRDLLWSGETPPPWDAVLPYLTERLGWMSSKSYLIETSPACATTSTSNSKE